MGERGKDGRIGLRSWASYTGLHLEPSGIQAGSTGPPSQPPATQGTRYPQTARLCSRWLNSPSPGMIRGCWSNPAAASAEPEMRDRWGVTVQSRGRSGQGAKRHSVSQEP